MYLVDATVICANGVTLGIVSGQGYTLGLEMLRGEVRGCAEGIAHGIGRIYGRFTETVLQNAKNFWFISHMAWPKEFRMTRVRHEPLGGHPSVFIGSADLPAWSGSGPFPSRRATHGRCLVGRGCGSRTGKARGRTTVLCIRHRSRTALAWPTRNPNQCMLPPPECGTTLGETWERCGMSLGGETFSPGTEVALQGIVGLVALPEPRKPLGPPRAIMTTPNARGSFTNSMDSRRTPLAQLRPHRKSGVGG